MPNVYKKIIPLMIFCFLFVQFATVLPREVRAEATEELKQIQYKYYFRGKYNEAIEALQSMLSREDLDPAVARQAREFLAASLVLTGSTAEGKDEFLKILNRDQAYAGPDAGLFQKEVIDVFNEAKVDYASLVIQRVNEIENTKVPVKELPLAAAETGGKPFYKKWWFYTGIGLVVVAAAAAGAKEEDAAPEEKNTGTVTVGVAVH